MPMWPRLRDSCCTKQQFLAWLVAKTDLPLSPVPTDAAQHHAQADKADKARRGGGGHQSHLNPERSRRFSHPRCHRGSQALFSVRSLLLAAWRAKGSVWPADVEGILCSEQTGLAMQ